MDPVLKSLISPHSVSEFFDQAWPKAPFVTHGLDQSIRELTSLLMLQSREAMLNVWPRTVQVHLPDVRDESSAIDATPDVARAKFADGMALLFNNVEKESIVLQNWLARLRRELGLPTATYSRCMVYATPDGKGTAPHFDQNINFVLQLHGTKTWWLAPNTHVENPTQRFTIGQPLDPELASYVEREMPSAMPGLGEGKCQKIVLKPGSMLFVPRGFWHSTSAEGEALALNFTFSQPTWVDLFTAALRSRLSLSPAWRELADGVTSNDEDRRALAQNRLDELLIELVHDLPHWEAADILAATEDLT